MSAMSDYDVANIAVGGFSHLVIVKARRLSPSFAESSR
jgi:hypothetical protein